MCIQGDNMDRKNKKLAIISCSGGIDSTTLLYTALNSNMDVITVSFQYQQKHSIEKYALMKVLREIKSTNKFKDNHIKHIDLNMSLFMDETLKNIANCRTDKTIENKTELEYYMPFRNLVFCSLSAMVGESVMIDSNYEELYIGLGIHKHSDVNYTKDYWDITSQFSDNLAQIFKLNDNITTKIFAPYAISFKGAIIKDALELNVPYRKTWTCYDPVKTPIGDDIISYSACHECEACMERQMFGDKYGATDINETNIILYDENAYDNNVALILNELMSIGDIDIGDDLSRMADLFKVCIEWTVINGQFTKEVALDIFNKKCILSHKIISYCKLLGYDPLDVRILANNDGMLQTEFINTVCLSNKLCDWVERKLLSAKDECEHALSVHSMLLM